MLQQTGYGLGLAMVFWVIWLAISVAALVAFFRGMRALVEIPRRLENIEQILASRPSGEL